MPLTTAEPLNLYLMSSPVRYAREQRQQLWKARSSSSSRATPLPLSEPRSQEWWHDMTLIMLGVILVIVGIVIGLEALVGIGTIILIIGLVLLLMATRR